MTIYARQIPPEYQKSPFDYKNYTDISFYENYVESHLIPQVKEIIKKLRSTDYFILEEQIQSIPSTAQIPNEITRKFKNLFSCAITEKIRDSINLNKNRKPSINTNQKLSALYETQYCVSLAYNILEETTEETFTYKHLQNEDHNDEIQIVYPSLFYSDSEIENIRIEYFNEGTQWETSTESFHTPTADNEHVIVGMRENAKIETVYSVYHEDTDIQMDIRNQLHLDESTEVKLYKFYKFIKVPTYSTP